MSLKLLFVPSLIVLCLILGIGFIKPDFDEFRQKRTALAAKEKEAANVENVVQNVSALNGFLDQHKDQENFVDHYYPSTLDQGRVIDTLNYLASQSGVSVSSMTLAEIETAKQEDDLGAGGPLTSVGTPGDPLAAGPMALVPSYTPPKPKAYEAKVTARGDYANLKAFLERLGSMDRLHDEKSFSIGNDTQSGQTGTPATGGEGEGQPASNLLSASFEARFEYLPVDKGVSALTIPVFSQNTIDLKAVESLKSGSLSEVPELTPASGGKANPFE
jgi:hypothetical protein